MIERLNELPIKTVEGAVIRVSDVAQVRDGYSPQQNIVRQDGTRSTLLSVLKSGTASTLDVATGVEAAMARVLNTVTSKLDVKEFADQSLFVTVGSVNPTLTGLVLSRKVAQAAVALATGAPPPP